MSVREHNLDEILYEVNTSMIYQSGGNSERVPPVPIPNTVVKPFSADGTWLVAAWESMTSPDFLFLSGSVVRASGC